MGLTLDFVLGKSLKRIALLHPIVGAAAEKVIRQAYAEGINIEVVQGLRTMDEQAALYAQGRTMPGDIVTNAKPGSSYHNYGLAFDYALLYADGSDVSWIVNDQWRRVGTIGESLGFVWGGRWTMQKEGIVDFPHLEMNFRLSISDLLSGRRPPQSTVTKGDSKVNVVKERIYATGGALKHCEGDYSKPASDVRYLKLDSSKVSFKFVARKGAKVSDLVKEFGADFGTNAPYFWDGQVLGDAIADGQVISSAYGKMLTWHEFGFKDGKAEIGQLDKNGGYDVLLQGAPLLVSNGNPTWDYYRVQEQVPDDIGKGNAQRTVYGIDANGDIHIAVADGRTKWDKGPLLEEMALYMQSKGCINVLNFDGGSSSVLADKTGSLGQNKGPDERAVNHALLIFIKAVTVPVTPSPVTDTVDTGIAFLKSEGYIIQDHKPDEPVTMSLLGLILKNKKEKGV